MASSWHFEGKQESMHRRIEVAKCIEATISVDRDRLQGVYRYIQVLRLVRSITETAWFVELGEKRHAQQENRAIAAKVVTVPSVQVIRVSIASSSAD